MPTLPQIRDTLWPANPYGRLGTLSFAGGLGIFVAVVAAWILTPPGTLVMAVFDPALTVSQGMVSVGIALVAHAAITAQIERFTLIDPTVPSDGEPPADLWPDAPATPTGFEDLRLVDSAPGSLAYIRLTIPVFPLFWVTGVIGSTIATVHPVTSVADGWATIGAIFGASVVVIALHELVHAAMATAFGYGVSFDHALPVAVGITLDGAVVQRTEQLWITVAPLVVLTPGLLFVALVASGWLAQVAYLLAVLNVLVAPGDVSQLFTFLRLSPGSLLYHPQDDAPVGVFEPAEAGPSVLQQIDRRVAALLGPKPAPVDGSVR